MIVECAAAIDNEYDSLSNATVHYHRHQNEYQNDTKTNALNYFMNLFHVDFLVSFSHFVYILFYCIVIHCFNIDPESSINVYRIIDNDELFHEMSTP